MDAVSFQDVQPKGEDDPGLAKRLLEVEETVLPDPKRAKMSSEETPLTGPDKGSHDVPGPSEATRQPQKGNQNKKNKASRRGTRPRVEDDPNRPRTPRLPKKQCAILLGFVGTNYAGMQMYVLFHPSP